MRQRNVKHTTIFSKETNEVIAYCVNGIWVLPNEWDVTASEDEPQFAEDNNGNLYYFSEVAN